MTWTGIPYRFSKLTLGQIRNMIYNNRAGDGVTITPPAFNVSKEAMTMQKIPTIFERDFLGNPSRVLDVKNPSCDWVFAGDGVATRKYDGTCCMCDGDAWWKRREIKAGKTAPQGFVEVAEDAKTGKRMGWMPVDDADKWHNEAIASAPMLAGTYELCGPKIQSNPEVMSLHTMISHADAEVINAPRDWHGLKQFMEAFNHEGLVFHHPDGRMAKIKRRDFY
jgi:hypothetical protein